MKEMILTTLDDVMIEDLPMLESYGFMMRFNRVKNLVVFWR